LSYREVCAQASSDTSGGSVLETATAGSHDDDTSES
jgi:hypothetical protein